MQLVNDAFIFPLFIELLVMSFLLASFIFNLLEVSFLNLES